LWEQALHALGQQQQEQQQQQTQQQQQHPSADLQGLQELLVRTLAASAQGPVRCLLQARAGAQLMAHHRA